MPDVRELSHLRTLNGEKLDLALTTNGHLLAGMAQPLKDAGLSRVTVSMDAVDPDIFAREIDRVFGANDWLYVCLEAEIPNPGDYKRSQLGTRDVVAVRGSDVVHSR